MQPEEYRDIEKGIVQQIAGQMAERVKLTDSSGDWLESDLQEIGERIECPHKEATNA